MGMSALGQKRTFRCAIAMSALPPKADMCAALAYVCFGPEADIREMTCMKQKGRLARGGLSNDR